MRILAKTSSIAIILCFLNTLCLAAPIASLADSQRVFQLMNERLNFMQVIAAYKYQYHVPVTVPIQERVIMNEAVNTALSMKLDGQSVRSFYEMQIAVAKEVQRSWMRRWDQEYVLRSSLPNKTSMNAWRKRLHAIDVQLLQSIVKAMPIIQDKNQLSHLQAQTLTEITNPYVSVPLKLGMMQALLRIKMQN